MGFDYHKPLPNGGAVIPALFFHPNSPVPRLSIATRFDTKLREKSFEKQNSAKAVLFTMYVSTV